MQNVTFALAKLLLRPLYQNGFTCAAVHVWRLSLIWTAGNLIFWGTLKLYCDSARLLKGIVP